MLPVTPGPSPSWLPESPSSLDFQEDGTATLLYCPSHSCSTVALCLESLFAFLSTRHTQSLRPPPLLLLETFREKVPRLQRETPTTAPRSRGVLGKSRRPGADKGSMFLQALERHKGFFLLKEEAVFTCWSF